MAKQDKQIEQLQEVVARKKAEISSVEKAQYHTNMSFTYQQDGGGGRVNLHTVSDIQSLALIAGFLISTTESYDKARKTLGLPIDDLKWNGYLVGDWFNDIKTRINKVELSKKKAQLEAAERTLESLLSPDAKTKKALSAIEDLLK